MLLSDKLPKTVRLCLLATAGLAALMQLCSRIDIFKDCALSFINCSRYSYGHVVIIVTINFAMERDSSPLFGSWLKHTRSFSMFVAGSIFGKRSSPTLAQADIFWRAYRNKVSECTICNFYCLSFSLA